MTDAITPISPAGITHLGADRRKETRAPLSIQALLRFQDRLQVLQGSVCDLSVGGTGFICHQVVAAHSKCKLQFVLPALAHTTGQAVDVAAIVISSMQVIGQAHQYRINLQFTNLPAAVRSHIEAYIRQSLNRG